MVRVYSDMKQLIVSPGGLFMDMGVVTLKSGALPLSTSGLPKASTTHPAIIEWRALTVILLYEIPDPRLMC